MSGIVYALHQLGDFHDFAPLNEYPFCPPLVFLNGNLKSFLVCLRALHEC